MQFDQFLSVLDQERLENHEIYYIQGVSSGFDIMYLALADRNMQVRSGLKVVWES